MAVSPPWKPQPQNTMRASSSTFLNPPLPPTQFLPPNPLSAPIAALEANSVILGESALQDGGVQGQDPGSPLSCSVNTVPPVPPVPHQALPGVQSQSTSLGKVGAAAQALTPGRLPTPEPPPQPPPCLKPAQGPGTLGEPHIGTRDAASHGLLGKRRRPAEGGWRASPAGPSPSALPDAPAQPSPVTLESLHRSLEDLRISVLRNLGAVHRQVEALEKRIHLLERWRAEVEGRQQPQQP